MNMDELGKQIERIAALVVRSQRLVVFSGAGQSTESGIPDFRGPGGIWERFDPDEFTFQKYMSGRESRKKHWDMLKQGFLTAPALPNAGHHAIAELDRMGRLDCVITQNVDGLYYQAGIPQDKIFELHGNMRRAVCMGCRRYYPFEEIKARLETGEEDPECPTCGGILKPDAVFFGEPLPAAVLEEASSRSLSCDLFMVVGSSLVVYPAAQMPVYASTAGARLVIINLSPTPMDHRADIVVQAKAGETLPLLVDAVKEKLGLS
jgi:NAD-dependent deacetylase